MAGRDALHERLQRADRHIFSTTYRRWCRSGHGDDRALLIGVDDKGTVLGLDNDYPRVKPPNGDGFVNWLATHLINAFGHTPVTRTRAVTDDEAAAYVATRWPALR